MSTLISTPTELPSDERCEGTGRAEPAAKVVFPRQLAAVLWILVAWVTGTVVFELTVLGGETEKLHIESAGDSFFGFFAEPAADQRIAGQHDELLSH